MLHNNVPIGLSKSIASSCYGALVFRENIVYFPMHAVSQQQASTLFCNRIRQVALHFGHSTSNSHAVRARPKLEVWKTESGVGRVTCCGLVLLNRFGSWSERSFIISFRGDLDSTGSCSQIVRLFSTVQGQILHNGLWALPGDGLAEGWTMTRSAFINARQLIVDDAERLVGARARIKSLHALSC